MKSETCIFVCVFMFLCTLKPGYSIECYTCNTTTQSAPTDKNPCKGFESVTKCQDPARCLTATYLYEDIGANIKRYTTIKTCNALMNGQECDNFLKNLKTMNSPSAKIEFYDQKCSTCHQETGGPCNGASAVSVLLPASMLASIVWYILCKLF